MNELEKSKFDNVLKIFDKDIKDNNSYLAKIDKQLFKLSINLSVNDWKLIRGKDYFEYTRKMGIIDKRLYLLELVKNYLGIK